MSSIDNPPNCINLACFGNWSSALRPLGYMYLGRYPQRYGDLVIRDATLSCGTSIPFGFIGIRCLFYLSTLCLMTACKKMRTPSEISSPPNPKRKTKYKRGYQKQLAVYSCSSVKSYTRSGQITAEPRSNTIHVPCSSAAQPPISRLGRYISP